MMLSPLRLRLASMLLVVVSADQWLSIPNKECGYKQNEATLAHGSLADFKAKADEEGHKVFVVWQGRAYYRNCSAEECLKKLQDPPHNNNVTLYYKSAPATTTMAAPAMATMAPTTAMATMAPTTTKIQSLVSIINDATNHGGDLPDIWDKDHGIGNLSVGAGLLKADVKKVVGANELMDAADKEQGLLSLRNLAVGLPCLLAGLVAVAAIAKQISISPLGKSNHRDLCRPEPLNTEEEDAERQ